MAMCSETTTVMSRSPTHLVALQDGMRDLSLGSRAPGKSVQRVSFAAKGILADVASANGLDVLRGCSRTFSGHPAFSCPRPTVYVAGSSPLISELRDLSLGLDSRFEGLAIVELLERISGQRAFWNFVESLPDSSGKDVSGILIDWMNSGPWNSHIRSFLRALGEDKVSRLVHAHGARIKHFESSPTIPLDKVFSYLEKMPNIETLSFYKCAITDGDFKIFSKTPKIEHLNFSYCHIITGAGFQDLDKLPLRSLTIQDCPSFTSPALGHLLSKYAPTLEFLNVSWCDWVTGEEFKDLPELPVLRKIVLSGCHHLTNEGLKEIPLKCTHLESVDLSCSPITRDTIRDLPGCATLNEIDLSSCDGLTTEGLRELLKKYPSVKSIDLSSVAGVDTDALRTEFPAVTIKF